MYAVIETGGKQHKVEKGMVLSVDLLKDDIGKKITFDKTINGFDLVKKISKSLEKKALIMKVDGDLKDLNFSQVFFIPAKKINFYLKIMKNYFSGRQLLIAKELTKLHEFFSIEKYSWLFEK